MNDETTKPQTQQKQNGATNENPYARVEEALGAVFNLMAAHPGYAGKTAKEIHERVLPAIATRQYRLVRKESGEAVAFLSWAFVSERVERRLAVKNKVPRPSDWQSGKTGLLMDVVAANPQMAHQMIKRLKADVFPDKRLKAFAMRRGANKAELKEVE